MKANPNIYQDLSPTQLTELAIKQNEGRFCSNGALVVTTGKRTGRSPKDRFYVDEPATTKKIDWGKINRPFDEEKFHALWQKAEKVLEEKPFFQSYYHAGADQNHYVALDVKTQTAWHQLFASSMFILPDQWNPKQKEAWQVMNVPSYVCDPAVDGTNSDGVVIIHLSAKKILCAGMQYAGEMKKAVFSVLNFLLPEKNILPMHCSANLTEDGKSTLFFGLSGTGKTTLSADPKRLLIGDDEHGWSKVGVFNFEGGCYAKCIDLSQKNEPIIWDAIKFGAVLENCMLDNQLTPDFTDTSLTENSRVAYPLTHVPKRSVDNRGPQPNAVVFLTCDLTGVLPPLARLSDNAAAYHFLSGYTALVGSTEIGGSNQTKSTFSMCFGAPFFPRPPQDYASLLIDLLKNSDAQVYLVNTGWTGGGYGSGKRFDIPTTRAVIDAVVDGTLNQNNFTHIADLNLDIPNHVEGVADDILDPEKTWQDPKAYQQAKQKLIKEFNRNFDKFTVSQTIKEAGPKLV